jgi:SAM-dependent methyltransferase
VVGDLESWTSPDRYDLVVCWNVLEHLDRPARAMKNIMEALDEGGVLVVGCPNLYSVKGAVTKLSPHWFHVWYYRRIKGGARAGEPGYAPFRTFLKPESSFRSIVRMAETSGFDLLIAQCYEGPEKEDLKRRSPLLYGIYEAVGTLAGALTWGRFQAKASDWAVIMRKPPAPQSTAGEPARVDRAASVAEPI